MSGAIADPVRGIVRVEGGTVWEPAVDAAAAHGRAVLHGSSPDVGIAGYSLGGGIGWYARKLGLATNSLTAVELVIADGTLVRADATTNPELFWAVRGGGGSFGVVTALEFRMYDIQHGVRRDADLGPRPDRAGAARVGRLGARTPPTRSPRRSARMRLPADARAARLPARPPAVRHRRRRARTPTSAAPELLAGLRALRPEIDTFARVPAKSLVRLHMDPEGGAPVVSDSAMLGVAARRPRSTPSSSEVGPDADDLAARWPSCASSAARWAVPPRAAGALTHLDAEFVAFGGRDGAHAGGGRPGRTPTRSALTGALAPFANGRQYLNFAENPVDTRTAYADGRRGASWPGSAAPSTRTGSSRPTTRCRGCGRTAGRPPERRATAAGSPAGQYDAPGGPGLEPGLEAHQRRGPHRQLHLALGAGAADHDVVGVERHLLDALRAPADRRRSAPSAARTRLGRGDSEKIRNHSSVSPE